MYLVVIKLVAVSRLSESHPFLSSKDIVSACESQTTDCKTLQLQGLSVLELQLVSSKTKLGTSHCSNTLISIYSLTYSSCA